MSGDVQARDEMARSGTDLRMEPIERARLEELVALGVLAGGSGRPLTPFEPVAVRGRPVSETLLEDRQDRF
jgi:hypothetical protein